MRGNAFCLIDMGQQQRYQYNIIEHQEQVDWVGAYDFAVLLLCHQLAAFVLTV
jgi:hypothetical protein